ncbi:MAG: hypothetical protein V3V33_02555 [Candidatus Lokiarchaeia archaeon]
MITAEKKNFIPTYVLGVGVIKLNSNGEINIIFQKGIGIQLIQKIIKSNKNEIIKKKNGIKIDLVCNYTVYIHYFDNQTDDIVVILYLDKKEKILKFSDLYLISEKLNNFICSNISLLALRNICNKNIRIPKSNGVIALFILNSSGHLFYSKFNKEKTKLKNFEIQISGFISALTIFSKELISQEPGVNLKKINFGKQNFYLVTEQNVIFAYLIEVEKKVDINKRYLSLVPEEFLSKYRDNIINFKGDVSVFNNFDQEIEQYFII